MTELNIFERAAKRKIRFETPNGLLSTEQLFDLPLVANTQVSLDEVAKTVNSALKSITEESFVEVKPHPQRADLTLKLEIVKHVIADKQAAAAAAEARKNRADERRKLVDALASKQDEKLKGLSEKEILRRLEAIDADLDEAA